jgi:hypothetical protein
LRRLDRRGRSRGGEHAEHAHQRENRDPSSHGFRPFNRPLPQRLA